MPAKKTGCLGKVLGVLFTSVVVPVLVNVFTQDVTDWQQKLGLAAEAGAPADWNRPTADSVPPPRITTCPDPDWRTDSRKEERKGRESNPQGVAAEPFSRRPPAPMGRPFR